MSIAEPGRVVPVVRTCPDKCPWGRHEESASQERCGDCGIERPRAEPAQANGNGDQSATQGWGGGRVHRDAARPADDTVVTHRGSK